MALLIPHQHPEKMKFHSQILFFLQISEFHCSQCSPRWNYWDDQELLKFSGCADGKTGRGETFGNERFWNCSKLDVFIPSSGDAWLHFGKFMITSVKFLFLLFCFIFFFVLFACGVTLPCQTHLGVLGLTPQNPKCSGQGSAGWVKALDSPQTQLPCTV